MSQTMPDQNEPKQREVAQNIKLPDPNKRRFPVGIVLIVLWVLVFLAIFLVLAWRKQNPPANPGPVLPETQQTTPAQPAPGTPDPTP